MRSFSVFYTGDYLDEAGKIAYPEIGLDLLEDVPYIRCGFLWDLKPSPGDDGYWERLYSLEVKPEHILQANALVVFRPWIKASAFSKGAGNLIAVARAGAGYDKIDIAACTENDVAVLNTPDTLAHSTASSALLLMLALAKRLPEQERLARSGCWDRQSELMGRDLIGLTLGIVGLGKSGSELARLAAPFNMRVIAYSPHADLARAQELGVTLVSSLYELLRESDFISLHCRLDDNTRRFIGETEFKMIKPTAYFINVARGEMVDQRALVRALREWWIAGAGLDVFEMEPLPADDPLTRLDNVILTPHWLPSTHQAARATMSQVADGIRDVSQGKLPKNIVNTDVLDRPGFHEKLAQFEENAAPEPAVLPRLARSTS
ncbi:MAG: D-glycerate dehydrogenase [Armatimonadetes bacterium]|nr:D-glycerate dehydrogenase [Armatimonadota bacterium]